MDIVKVVIPAAGLGTRFLPWTKNLPKEMLPLLNKPALQYVIEEALASAVSHFIMITSKDKNLVLDYFEQDPHLSALLKERHKHESLASVERISRLTHFTNIRQSEPLGLGHAVWLARHAIGKEYFGIMLPDDLIMSKQPGLAQLIRIARQEKASVIAVQEVPTDKVSQYGIIGIKKQITPNLFQVSHLVEKPHPKDAPSHLAVVGRYVLSHKLFASLERIGAYACGEMQLTDAISDMLHNNERVFAYKLSGMRYDIGTPIGWLDAVIGYALANPEYSTTVKHLLAHYNNSLHPLAPYLPAGDTTTDLL